MHMPVQVPEPKASFESSFAIWLQTEAMLKQVEFHIEDAKKRIATIKQQLAAFELPRG